MLNKKIEYFVTLAECLSFTQAAAVHSVSQTAISQYIASLEGKLQVRLFNRNAHSVSLTDAGQFFMNGLILCCAMTKTPKSASSPLQSSIAATLKWESACTIPTYGGFLLPFLNCSSRN